MADRSFWRTAAADPNRAAVIEVDGATTTYGELASLANQIANGLRGRGLKVGDRVALLMSNRVEFLAILLATHQIGLQLALLNRHLTAVEAGYILADCRADCLIADAVVADAAASAAQIAGMGVDARFSLGEIDGFLPFEELLGSPGQPAERTAGSLLFYSSGTTGRPKGIERALSGLDPAFELDLLGRWLRSLGGTTDGVHLAVGPLYHAGPNVHTLAALQLAQTVVLGSGFNALKALEFIERHRVTDTYLVPTMMHRLMSLPEDVRRRHETASLRFVLHSAAMCPVATKRAMIDWLGPILVETYGATESGVVTVIDSHQWLDRPGSVGRPGRGFDVKVFDESGSELGPGEPGLLHLKTNQSFEYRGDPEKTRSSHRDGYFVPGDIGYLDDDGWLYICDRRTDMIVSGGVNIYPAEIEGELVAHEAVADAVVIGIPDDEWGAKVVALVELRDGVSKGDDTVQAILGRCRERLANFKVPRILRIVDALPRTPSGKINRGNVRSAYLADLQGSRDG
jgi:long-chain acyl-CoA synthetase